MYRSGRSRWTCLGVLFAWSTTAGALPASAPGARAPVVVSRAEGDTSGTFTLETDAAAPPLVALSVQGQGGGISLEAEPRAIDFGAVLVGQTASRVFTLSNLGEDDVELRSIGFLTGGLDFAPRAWTSMGVSIDLALPLRLKAKSQLSVPVTFSPTETAPLPPLFAIPIAYTQDGEQVRSAVRFDGRGLAPRAQLTPTSLDFGAIRVNQSAAPRRLTLQNTGTSPLTLRTLRLEGPQGAAFTLDPIALPHTLAPEARLEVNVVFLPSGDQAYTALLRLESDDPVSPSTQVELRGQGSLHSIQTSARALDFGEVEVGQRSEPRAVTLTNVSNEPQRVTLKPREASGASFLVDDAPLAEPLAPGASVTLPVTFQPQAEGNLRDEVEVWLAEQRTPDSTLTVSGTGRRAPTSPPLSDTDKGGCATGGALPSGLALGALLLVARRRSRRA
ncbi:choice-of-anchor D domain-containing protein [Archangium primigenium]|uniref:choice-of-anchor D domain-containing protein n=1 Tax=[Archangium] primigenium TaxID=2792470 RepID=UPI00195D13C8|nr:choice-of-anchor D domain-containing protein [Archangium primigenium]MBM7119136.1 choice-of-anchor D domain-containing protein [Archangium primigenium]